MKLLVTGDWHYRANPPRARLDDFQATLDRKILEVFEIAIDHSCDAIVVPGDLTDSPNLAYSTLTRLECLLEQKPCSIVAIAGNHDEFANSPESLDRTAWGHLAQTGKVRNLALNPLFYKQTVYIEGRHFSPDTDNGLDDYLATIDGTPVSVVVAHGMLLEREPGFELKHTLLTDVAKHPQCPDIVICGHEHLGFGVKRLPRARGGELVAINPGALVRLSAHPGEIERIPQVCLLEVYPGIAPICWDCEGALVSDKNDTARCPKCGITYYHVSEQFGSEYGPPEIWSIGHPVIETTLIPLKTARPGHEVLSRQHIEQATEREAKMGQFLELLSREGEAKFLDLQAIVEGVAKSENLPRAVVDEALSRIAAAREALGGRGRVA